MVIIGLAGTLNAGKDSLGEWLQQQHGFLHISTSDMIRQMKRRQFGDGPEGDLGRNDPFINKLRKERGPGLLVDAVYEEWKARQDEYENGCIASGIRAIGEAEKIHELNGIVVFVDADPKVRYERSQRRLRDASEAGRSFEEFLETERSEIDVDPNDKNVQNLAAMKKMADIIIENNVNSIEDFIKIAEEKLKAYL